MNITRESEDPPQSTPKKTPPTQDAPPSDELDDLAVLASGGVSDAVYAQVARLQEELTAQKDSRREERFYFITALAVLVNIIAFQLLHPFESLILASLQVAGLTLLARNSGFEDFDRIFDRLIGRWSNRKSDDEV